MVRSVMAEAPPPLGPGDALFLDFDGTLVELADSPDSIAVPNGLAPLLERIARRLGGRTAIVSGRSVEDLSRHIAPSGIAVSGSHGLELVLPQGTPSQLEVPAGLALASAEAARFARVERGLMVEAKPGGIAMHYRAAPEAAERVTAFAESLARRCGFRVQHGKMVAELVAPGADKGAAVRRIMREPGFAGARPLFVGDDLTDEHGFEAASALGGGGVLVGERRETAALWRLPDVAAVHAWLEQAAG